MTAPDLTPEQRETERQGAAAHDTYRHREDGRVCILDERGFWFTPLDAGGEGFDCERQHGDTARAEGDRQGAARVTAAVRAVVDRWFTNEPPWAPMFQQFRVSLGCNIRAALAEAQEADQ